MITLDEGTTAFVALILGVIGSVIAWVVSNWKSFRDRRKADIDAQVTERGEVEIARMTMGVDVNKELFNRVNILLERVDKYSVQLVAAQQQASKAESKATSALERAVHAEQEATRWREAADEWRQSAETFQEMADTLGNEASQLRERVRTLEAEVFRLRKAVGELTT